MLMVHPLACGRVNILASDPFAQLANSLGPKEREYFHVLESRLTLTLALALTLALTTPRSESTSTCWSAA